MEQDQEQIHDEQQIPSQDISEPDQMAIDDIQPIEVDPVANEIFELANKHKSGASWFYWVAGLSLINTVIFLSGSDVSFIVGLGITQLVDGIMSEVAIELGTAATAVAVAINVIVLAVVVMFGVFANRRHTWAYIVGIVLYSMDGLLFLMVGDLLSLGFHAFVLFCLWSGMTACIKLNQIERELTMTPPTTPGPMNN